MLKKCSLEVFKKAVDELLGICKDRQSNSWVTQYVPFVLQFHRIIFLTISTYPFLTCVPLHI